MSLTADHVAHRHGFRERVSAAEAETKVAVAAIGVIAWHVLDDSFFQPEPGMSAADHLVSGLVHLALLVGAAVAYPRLRPGLRAALAIALGVLGIVMGKHRSRLLRPERGPLG